MIILAVYSDTSIDMPMRTYRSNVFFAILLFEAIDSDIKFIKQGSNFLESGRLDGFSYTCVNQIWELDFA